MKKYTNFKKEILKDKVVKNAYNNLEPEFIIIQKIIEKRIKSGLTQAQLAKKVGTKQSAISRFEQGSYNPTISFLNKITKALDVKLNISIS
ncbi:helix-turn-helix transcriptional regulator [bacterium]|jgi:ribosome-binding protein aMBF1 (putative translation factor)|nr:helix-turn-helix transcriptional regulator [bacterium]MBT4121842.1 helix-turn-helix transcriptional regulator [bacterium]MBT4335589.1 helix-turn-helix transcriptional regulator [bacterium]MBT4495586.1 helix-turn-helix transcriptional regulator [bacterium]MBT4764244.1 helix-turn-helix transcriptional regulator [bacterium]